ncbi:MAG: hypothetical protein M3527_07620 [Actinomycetota bacterium]|nr:hypothetical protein [Acidimicrobiia bacterium]MDQ3294302.1 hypothetical protein [Actinomycetota bacterium]
MANPVYAVEVLELPFPPHRACPTDRSALGTFADCPMCGSGLAPEHAHFRCTVCGWRDSCCD